VDFQFEQALVNLLAYWIDELDDEGQDATMLPVIMYRLGWLIDEGVGNYGNLHSIEIAEVLKNEARRRGYEPPKELT